VTSWCDKCSGGGTVGLPYSGALKMQDLKIKDQVSWHENVGPEIEGSK